MSRRTLVVLLAAALAFGGSAAIAHAPVAADGITSHLRRGSLQWDVAALDSEIVGTGGPLYRFNVKTEVELAYEADRFAREAMTILSDQRSWIGRKNVRFQLVSGGSGSGTGPDPGVDFTLYLAAPSSVDVLCAPLRTRGVLSCRNGNRVVENIDRWMRGPDVFHHAFDGALDVYRTYLINHEVGHRIGKPHENNVACRPDRFAPVMMQQTFDVRGCAINGWPAHDLLTVGTEPVVSPVRVPPSGPCDTQSVFPWTADDRPLDDAVDRLYQAAFGRDADDEGRSFWIKERARGRSPHSLAAAFLGSPEGDERFAGTSIPEFVEKLYQNVLGRAADESGRDFWVGQIAGGRARSDVLLAFSESAENVARTTTSPPQSSRHGWLSRLYRAVLDRHPDCEGARYWLWVDTGRDSIVAAFVAGPEFQRRFGVETEEGFVELLYTGVLGRSSDAEGARYWLGELRSGRLDRAGLVSRWLDAPEFVVRTGTTP